MWRRARPIDSPNDNTNAFALATRDGKVDTFDTSRARGRIDGGIITICIRRVHRLIIPRLLIGIDYDYAGPSPSLPPRFVGTGQNGLRVAEKTRRDLFERSRRGESAETARGKFRNHSKPPPSDLSREPIENRSRARRRARGFSLLLFFLFVFFFLVFFVAIHSGA